MRLSAIHSASLLYFAPTAPQHCSSITALIKQILQVVVFWQVNTTWLKTLTICRNKREKSEEIKVKKMKIYIFAYGNRKTLKLQIYTYIRTYVQTFSLFSSPCVGLWNNDAFAASLPIRIRMEHLTAITQEEANSLRKKEVAGKPSCASHFQIQTHCLRSLSLPFRCSGHAEDAVGQLRPEPAAGGQWLPQAESGHWDVPQVKPPRRRRRPLRLHWVSWKEVQQTEAAPPHITFAWSQQAESLHVVKMIFSHASLFHQGVQKHIFFFLT